MYRDFSTFLNVTELSDQFVTELFNFARLAAKIIYIYRKSTPLEAVVQ